jgi:DNA processing protein
VRSRCPSIGHCSGHGIRGVARGVDTASHRVAISAKGRTVAAFGTGVGLVDPKENSRLSDELLARGGALIFEFPLGTFAAPQNFPIRKQIISGMSVGVLVVEAAEYSGTRLTARSALERNRDVFAVPATSPTRIHGNRTPSPNRARS